MLFIDLMFSFSVSIVFTERAQVSRFPFASGVRDSFTFLLQVFVFVKPHDLFLRRVSVCFHLNSSVML